MHPFEAERDQLAFKAIRPWPARKLAALLSIKLPSSLGCAAQACQVGWSLETAEELLEVF